MQVLNIVQYLPGWRADAFRPRMVSPAGTATTMAPPLSLRNAHWVCGCSPERLAMRRQLSLQYVGTRQCTHTLTVLPLGFDLRQFSHSAAAVWLVVGVRGGVVSMIAWARTC
jgi:hypothetical protein